ncbi:carboxylesterase family protein [Sphingomonas aerophila]|uniref:Carboxylic ester hydrolase n=1 Tax=Sphingomonas aerophila TaxID=1344948 RepID=A0A7W9EX68_9SPHN|nr:para-nitrobenzyl esterase [Sphingomonas aerophila]
MKTRFLSLLLGLAATPGLAGPVVTVAQGKVEGSSTAGVSVFKAVPYAAPPIGKLRWKPPTQALSWAGVRQGTAFGAVCSQAPVDWAGHDLDRTSEDCLTLNIWTPQVSDGARLPVLVWFHGGGYTGGAGSQRTYEGSNLARRGAVIVTVNYRLGVLGYMAHPALSKEAPLGTSGNYGLLDQIAALEWVRANIARFGGNPANVAVAGQSAGGGSAMLVTVSPLARGLFQKAIFESGAALDLPGTAQGSSFKRAELAGGAFAKRLGATTLDKLRGLPVSALIAPGAPRAITSPVQDGRVVPLDITAAYQGRHDAGVPVLLGWNSNEAARFVTHATLATYAASASADYGLLAPDLLRLYPAGDDATATRAAQNLMSDAGFGWRSWSIAQARSSGKPASVFLYQFDNPPPGPDGSRADGAVHSDELDYVWGNADAKDRWSAADILLSDTMQRYWVNFLRTGDPNGPGLPLWAPYRASETALWLRRNELRNEAPLREEKLRNIDELSRRAKAGAARSRQMGAARR